MKKRNSYKHFKLVALIVLAASFVLCACGDDDDKKADSNEAELDINIQSSSETDGANGEGGSAAGGDYAGVITFVDPTPTPEPVNEPEPEPEEEVVKGALDGLVRVTADNVNIRSVPEAAGASNVVAKAQQGEMFECYEADPNWVKINYLGSEAYIAREFVILEGNRNAIPGANLVEAPEENAEGESAEN